MTPVPQLLSEDLASPPARRPRPRAWRDPRLVVGVALVAGSGLLGVALLGGEDTVAVWAVAAPLEEGRRLGPGDVVRREVGLGERDAARYLSADRPLPAGAVLARPVGAGELLPAGALGAGEQAVWEVPLAVPVEQVPATVGVGSTVDVWVTPDPAAGVPGGRGSVRVLDGVRVVDLPRSGGFGAGDTRQVVVALPEDRAGELPEALTRVAQGTVVLVRTP